MEKIDLNKIRGSWTEDYILPDGFHRMAGGDDTIESIKMVAEKVNEIIDYLAPKETRIRIYGRKDGRNAELWIEETGLPNSKETLSYMTIDELLDLKGEIETALKEITI